MLRLAGELADGVLLNYLPATHVPWSVEQVRKGGPATIYAYVHAGVVADRADGIEAARRDLFSYAVVDAYARSFSRAGFADEVAEIRERHAQGDREGAVGAVSDRMVDAIDVMGDADTVRDTVRAYVDAGVDVPVLMPLPWGPDRMAVTVATMEASRTGLRGDDRGARRTRSSWSPAAPAASAARSPAGSAPTAPPASSSPTSTRTAPRRWPLRSPGPEAPRSRCRRTSRSRPR